MLKIVRLSKDERRFAATLMQKLGKGEASSIAVAKFRALKFFSDDVDARREVMKLGLKVHGTITVLLLRVGGGVAYEIAEESAGGVNEEGQEVR